MDVGLLGRCKSMCLTVYLFLVKLIFGTFLDLFAIPINLVAVNFNSGLELQKQS